MNIPSKFTISFVFYLLSSFIFIKISSPRFGTNDDYFFNELLSGNFTGTPYFFTNLNQASPRTLFSLPVGLLYQISSSINWYIILLLVIVIFSLSILNVVIFCLSPKFLSIFFGALTVSVSAFALFWWISAPTYTAAAFFPAIASGGLLTYYGRHTDYRKKVILLASFMFSISISIRLESALVPLALIVIPIAVKLLVENLSEHLKNLAIFFIFIAGAHLVNEVSQKVVLNSTEDWKTYSQIESVRYQIHENKFQRVLNDFPEAFEWEQAKINLFLSYNYADQAIYNQESILKLGEELASFDDNYKIRWRDIERRINDRVGYFLDIWKLSIFVSLIIVLAYRKQKNFVLLSATHVIFLTLSLYVMIYLRSPERIVVPSLITLLFSLMILSVLDENEREGTPFDLFVFNILPIVFVVLFMYPLSKFQFQRSTNEHLSNFAIEQANDLQKVSGTGIFVGNASQFRWDWTDPFNFKPAPYTAVPTGWYNFSPPWKQRVANYGLSENAFYGNLSNDRFLFLSNDQTIDQLASLYLNENGIEISFELLFEKSFDFGSYNVYKVRGGSSVG